MKKALIIYGSTTGNTETMAAIVDKGLRAEGLQTRLLSVDAASPDDLTGDQDLVALGCPAYGHDDIELQDDFAEFYEAMDGMDLRGRKFAVFAPGDSAYPHFCGSVDMIEDRLKALGGTILSDGLKVDGYPDDEEDEIIQWSKDLVRSL